MKTLLFTQEYPPSVGGIARLFEQLAFHYPPGGVEVCTVAQPPELIPAEERVPVHRTPFAAREAKRLTRVAEWSRWTVDYVRHAGIDALQIGNVRPTGYVGAWVQWRTGTPYILFVHGKDVLKEEAKASAGLGRFGPRHFGARQIFGRAAAIIANSEETAARTRSLIRRLGLEDRGRVRVVHPGTDPDRFSPAIHGGAWRSRLDAGPGPVLLSVGRLMRRKGVDTVIRALPELRRAHPGLVYAVAGGGPYRAGLEALATELGVGDAVRFLGLVPEDELPSLYASADVFVLPNREEPDEQEIEGFGIVFAEASATGVPVVAGRSGGAPDAVRHEETGLLVDPTDPDDVRRALDRLLSDANLRMQLGSGGRRAVETYYNWDRAAAQIWEILVEITSPGREADEA